MNFLNFNFNLRDVSSIKIIIRDVFYEIYNKFVWIMDLVICCFLLEFI